MRSRHLINGFIRQSDENLKNKIIPSEINEICFVFYFTSKPLFYYSRATQENENGFYIYDIDNNRYLECQMPGISTDSTPVKKEQLCEVDVCSLIGDIISDEPKSSYQIRLPQPHNIINMANTLNLFGQSNAELSIPTSEMVAVVKRTNHAFLHSTDISAKNQFFTMAVSMLQCAGIEQKENDVNLNRSILLVGSISGRDMLVQARDLIWKADQMKAPIATFGTVAGTPGKICRLLRSGQLNLQGMNLIAIAFIGADALINMGGQMQYICNHLPDNLKVIWCDSSPAGVQLIRNCGAKSLKIDAHEEDSDDDVVMTQGNFVPFEESGDFKMRDRRETDCTTIANEEW